MLRQRCCVLRGWRRDGGGMRVGWSRLLVACSGPESESESDDEVEEAEEDVGSESATSDEADVEGNDGEEADGESETCPSSSPSTTDALTFWGLSKFGIFI